jgi:hypothetical protein
MAFYLVDQDIVAVLSQAIDLIATLDAETLRRKRGFQPWPVKATDVHPHFQVHGIYFQGVEHIRSIPSAYVSAPLSP